MTRTARSRRLPFSASPRLSILCVSIFLLLLLTTTLPAAESTLIPDDQIVARAVTLSVEERRYLVYLYARLGKPKVAESLANSLLVTTPDDRQTLLVLASLYLEQKDASATLRTARRLLAASPDDPQALHYLALGHHLAGDFATAHRVLRELKQTQFSGRKFPYEADLAAAAAAEGDWHRAMLAYEELLRQGDLDDEFRAEVRQALDTLHREHLPRFELTAAQVRLDQAKVGRAGAAHGRHLGERLWFEQRYTRDEVTLDAAAGLLASRRTRDEFAAHLAAMPDRRWRAEAWLGHPVAGVDDRRSEKLFGGARATHTFGPQREASLELAANVRATDSLTLEALDGRQHQLAFATTWLVATDLVFTLRGQARELRVAGAALGRATGADINLDYTLLRRGPRLVVGYRGALARFSVDTAFDPAAVAPIADPLGGLPTQQALVANLVSPRINRHGTGLLLTDTLARAWVYRLTAGVDYDFELSSTAWNGALALTFSPRPRLELTGEVGYTSSASASNAGSAALLLNLFLRIHY